MNKKRIIQHFVLIIFLFAGISNIMGQTVIQVGNNNAHTPLIIIQGDNAPDVFTADANYDVVTLAPPIRLKVGNSTDMRQYEEDPLYYQVNYNYTIDNLTPNQATITPYELYNIGLFEYEY